MDNPLPETLSATPSPLDEIRARLEMAWLAASPSGTLPHIEDQLGGLADADRRALLPELVALEVAYRRQRGEQPRAEEYRARFPELSPDWLERELAAPPQTNTAAQPALTRTGCTLRCPHCQNPIHLTDAPGDVVLCPGCGGSFRVRDARCTDTTSASRPLGRFQLLPVLDKALAAKPLPESKRRLEDLRGQLSGMVLHGESLRAVRVVEVLERIGTPEARLVVQALAEGAPGALLTTSAQAARKR